MADDTAASSPLTTPGASPEPEIPESAEASTTKPQNDDASAPTTTNGASKPADAENRRRSTRVVKKTQPYVEPPSTRKPKRKRPVREEEDEEAQEKEPEEEDGGDKASVASGETGTHEETPDVDDDRDNDVEEGSESESEEEEDEDEEEPDEYGPKGQRNKRAGARGRGGKGRGGARGGARAGAKAAKSDRPAVKRVKTTKGAVPVRGSKSPRPKKAKAKPKGPAKSKAATNGAPVQLDSLYVSVFQEDEEMEWDDIATTWLDQYEENSAEAMKQLVNFVLKCCGCDKQVTNYDIEDQDTATDTLSQIQEAFQRQQTAEYPLTSKKPEFRHFRKRLSAFIEALISTADSKGLLINDPALMENMQVWIAAMSSSTLRQFRHTSTVIALEMLSHLCKASAKVRRMIGVGNRQIEAEKAKESPNDARVKSMEDKAKDQESHREAVENVIKDIFQTVFVLRYRDIDPRIRSDCVHELGEWIVSLPDVFFEGSYLRYLGWVLSDTAPATRLECVKALIKLFRRKDSVSGLRHFTERFRERLVEMGTRDADSTVRAATVELLDVIRSVGYLEPKDIDTIGRLLFDSEQKVRRAVVSFFKENINDLYQEKLEELGGEDASTELKADQENEEYDGPTLQWLKIKCLVEVLSSYDQEEPDDDAETQRENLVEKNSSIVMKVGEVVSRFSLAGAVLWDAISEVRDWEGLARYLLYDHSASLVTQEGEDDEDIHRQLKKTVALAPKEDVILLQVLNASVAGSLVKGPDAETLKKRTGQTVKTPKEIEKHKEILSRNLMKFIPLLLKKFGPVPDAASSVLRLEQLMNLEIFQELRQSDAYSSLLDDINRQFLTHADEGVLKEASAALMHAKSFPDLEEVTEGKLTHLKDETSAALVNAIQGKDLNKGKFSDASLTELINTVRRLEYLAGITDCVDLMENSPASSSAMDKPLDILLELLNRGDSTDELEEELFQRSITTLRLYFMWRISTLQKYPEAVSEQEIEDLLKHKQVAGDTIARVIALRPDQSDAIVVSAAGALLDLATLFGTTPALPTTSDPEQKQIAKGTQVQLLSIFNAIEKAYATASARHLDPDENAAPVDEEENPEEADETTKIMLEHRLVDFAAKVVIAVLAGVVDVPGWKKRLERNHLLLGGNYKEVVAHMEGKSSAPHHPQKTGPSGRRRRIVVGKVERRKKKKVEEPVEEDEETPAPEEEEGEAEGADEEPEAEPEAEAPADEADRESEPDPEAPMVDGDGDAEMADA